ncbi:hypothetical protein LEMLEM_LOCUS13598 [Lemmus lemmus]
MQLGHEKLNYSLSIFANVSSRSTSRAPLPSLTAEKGPRSQHVSDVGQSFKLTQTTTHWEMILLVCLNGEHT